MNRHVKSRSGCKVCKRKRLKCDETTPACLNCVRRGIACPGYQHPLRWSTKHESRRELQFADPPDFYQLASAASCSIQRTPERPNSAITEPPARSVSGLPEAPESSRITSLPDAEHSYQSLDASPEFIYADASESVVSNCQTPGAENLDQHAIFNDQGRGFGTTSHALVELLSCDVLPQNTELEENNTLSTNDEGHEPLCSPEYDEYLMMNRQDGNPATLSRSLYQPSTSLIEFWFKSVCGAWAAFDSPSNPFRRLCSSLWTSSGSVFYSMQSMAAASLPVHPPSIKEVVVMAPQMSTKALIQELQDLFREPNAVQKLPAGLLISLFCMSSSQSWIDSRQLGIQYLRNARAVLDLLDMRAHFLSREDKELLEFFRGCLIYEEMLRSIVSSDDEDIKALLEWRSPSIDTGVLIFHAWTGVPASILSLFGKVMALCRKSRKLWQDSAHATYTLMYQAVSHIQEAKELEEKLLAIDVPNVADSPSIPVDGEEECIRDHLYMATEAFRLSSLLQLYQTFPDLVSQRLPSQVAANGVVLQDRWLIPLALHITMILKRIPPDSGMRCLQPLLCICAGGALRYEPTIDTSLVADPAPECENLGFQVGSMTLDAFLSLSASSTSSLQIEQAREFLRRRLGHLEQNLPQKPIAVARRLLEKIWLTIDQELPPKRSHWLDIMTSNRFESVFG